MTNRHLFCLVLFFVVPITRIAATERVIDLDGSWFFALDPLDRGEQLGWANPAVDWLGEGAHPGAGWDQAVVPHDFLSDPRYQYTGHAWYRRSFAVPLDVEERQAWRLQFDAVYQRCRVWINGEFVGAHEGGYTPFEFVVTDHIRRDRQNFIVVAVDNRIRFRALPGGRTGVTASAQMFPWMNYGGILGAVRLLAHDPIYISSQIIQAVPGSEAGAASIVARVRVRNDAGAAQNVHVNVTVGEILTMGKDVVVDARTERIVELRGRISDPTVKLWSLEEPHLYVARTTVINGMTEHVREDAIGIRRIDIRDARFLLNGEPVRLAGANRARGHPAQGGRDTDEVVAEDLKLMKAAGLRFARLQHTAPGRNLLDWCDRNGMLLILEVGMWGYTAPDLASAELRKQFRAEMRELIGLAANHPCVVGWSLGNEFQSWTPEGIAWTRDMEAFVKELDPGRPVTFAALGTALQRLRSDPAGEHAFDHVDFISTNLYFPPEDIPVFLDPVHVRWPGKPVFVSEFGLRADRVKSERERIEHFDQVIAVARARPWICGLSYWSFNDYKSRYPGSGPDGYRRWGLVDEWREPRALFEHVAKSLREGGMEPRPAP